MTSKQKLLDMLLERYVSLLSGIFKLSEEDFDTDGTADVLVNVLKKHVENSLEVFTEEEAEKFLELQGVLEASLTVNIEANMDQIASEIEEAFSQAFPEDDIPNQKVMH